MKITTPLALALTMLLAMAFGVPKASADDGKDIFLSSKCTKCHSLKSAGIESQKSDDEEDEDKAPPPDLSGLKGKHRFGVVARVAYQRNRKHRR